MPSILDSSFKYTPAAKTDISKTFKRVRRELASSCISSVDNASQKLIDDNLIDEFKFYDDMFINYPY